MKRIDASQTGIFDIAWSPDGKWLTYVSGDEVRLANVETQEIRIIGSGRSPSLTPQLSVLLERDDEILLVEGSGTRTALAGRDLVRDTPKREPALSPDGRLFVAVVCNVFDKTSQSLNAYPHRHFLAVIPMRDGKPILTREQWYGGKAAWFPRGDRFTHFEFDSTAGPQVHVVSAGGERQHTVAGLYPAISPDEAHIAARPRGGGSVVVYGLKGPGEDIETTVVRVPAAEIGRPTANPPIWLDNRLILVDEGGIVWRIDTRRDKAEEMRRIPAPVERRRQSMIASPDRSLIAMEVAGEKGFELCVLPPN